MIGYVGELVEQAKNELNTQEDPATSEFQTDIERGQKRLEKAYKILVDSKGKNKDRFDDAYKAIVCYNLSCSY